MAIQDDVNEQVSQIKSDVASVADQSVSLASVKAALVALADAIDAVAGNTTAARAAINLIPNQSNVSFSGSKASLDGLVKLLVDDSNFSGEQQ